MLVLFFKWKEYMFSGMYYRNILLNGYMDIINNAIHIFLFSINTLILLKILMRRKRYINYLSLALWSAYTSLVLQLTVIGRTFREETMIKVFEGWGELSEKEMMEAITNCVMLFPFTFFLLIGIGNLIFKKPGFFRIMFFAIIVSFLFSLSIEYSQMHWGKGTFQISDLVYNTGGGVVAGFIYWLFAFIKGFSDIIIDLLDKQLAKRTADK